MAVDRERVAALVRELLEAIGEDPDRPGLKLTPGRVADAYTEFFAGVGEDAAAPLAHTISVTRGPAPETLPSGAVMVRDIRFRSICEHHLLPFRGHAHIAYLPGEQVVGLRRDDGIDQIVPRTLVAEMDFQTVVEEGEEVRAQQTGPGGSLGADAPLVTGNGVVEVLLAIDVA